jgi:predicted RNase H-like HicB family nuclease
MRYPIAIEPGNDSQAYGVVVPDLPGCFSAGDTIDEAMSNAQEAILLHLEGYLDQSLAFPTPGSIEEHRKNSDYESWVWALVEVDLSQLENGVERINITIPKKILRVIDAGAARTGESRSAFLSNAGLEAARQAVVR